MHLVASPFMSCVLDTIWHVNDKDQIHVKWNYWFLIQKFQISNLGESS